MLFFGGELASFTPFVVPLPQVVSTSPAIYKHPPYHSSYPSLSWRRDSALCLPLTQRDHETKAPTGQRPSARNKKSSASARPRRTQLSVCQPAPREICVSACFSSSMLRLLGVGFEGDVLRRLRCRRGRVGACEGCVGGLLFLGFGRRGMRLRCIPLSCSRSWCCCFCSRLLVAFGGC